MSIYIKSFGCMGTDPRLKRLATCLEVSKPEAVGLLHFLWWFAINFAEKGRLNSFNAAEIAEACCWAKDPGRFLKGLKSAGWLNARHELSDWDSIAGNLLRARELSIKKQQAYRDRQSGRRDSTEEGNVTVTRSAPPTVTRPSRYGPSRVEESRVEKSKEEKSGDGAPVVGQSQAAPNAPSHPLSNGPASRTLPSEADWFKAAQSAGMNATDAREEWANQMRQNAPWQKVRNSQNSLRHHAEFVLSCHQRRATQARPNTQPPPKLTNVIQ